jgi:hypothetical protein
MGGAGFVAVGGTLPASVSTATGGNQATAGTTNATGTGNTGGRSAAVAGTGGGPVAGASNTESKQCKGTLSYGDFSPMMWLFANQALYGMAAQSVLRDVNGDKNLDYVVANNAEGTLGVFLGNGDGTFADQNEYGTGAPRFNVHYEVGGPASVALGDLDGNGTLDAVAANNYLGTVAVLFGAGDGTFEYRAEYPVGTMPYSAELGDLNGDTQLDIAVANHDSDSVSLLIGNGDGTFAPKSDFPVGRGPRKLTLGDLNGDHNIDIVTVNDVSDTVSALLGSGNGAFAATPDSSTGSNVTASNRSSTSVELGDLNGDARLDVVVAADQVVVMLGDGQGGFAQPVHYVDGGVRDWIALTDLNGDSKTDILFKGNNGGGVGALLGSGDGTFGAATTCTALTDVGTAAAGDLDGDGKPDVAFEYTLETGAGLGVWLGNGTGTFAQSHSVAGVKQYRSTSGGIALGDLNRDSRLDIVRLGDIGGGTGTARVLLGADSGGFKPDAEYAVGLEPGSVALGDFDGDGSLDVLTSSLNYSTPISLQGMSVLLGNGDGTFRGSVEFTTAADASAIAVADLNADGRTDLVAAFDPGPLSVYLAKGDGKFADPADYSPGIGPVSIAIGDVDRDTKPDLLVANNGGASGPSSASVLLGKGDGTFASKVDYAFPSLTLRSIAVGDLDRDGTLDFLVTGGLGAMAVWRGNGDGTFVPQGEYETTWYARSPVIRDFDGDGIPDVMLQNYSGSSADLNTVSLLLGNGDGSLRAHVDYPFEAVSLAVADINGDGRLDLAMTQTWGDTVDVLLGSCR